MITANGMIPPRAFGGVGPWLVVWAALIAGPAHAAESHAIAMHGAPALPADFTHFGYANPAAPKGGRLVQGVLGSFDSLNPFTVKGLAPQGLRAPLTSANNAITGYVVESLMVRGYDEPFTLYGLLAKSVETDAARTHVTFTLDPEARFSDGKPVTAEDVVFTWRLLRDHGRPNHRIYYSKVTKAEVIGERQVRFDLAGDDRELPLILALMPVLAKHAIDPEKFEDTSMTPLVGSGPYRVSQVDAGKSITLARNAEYWGRDRAVNRGFWNFDEVRFDYYRDANAYHEAFKKGLFDVRKEDDPGRWTTGYDFPAFRDGRVIKETFTSGLPKPSLNFVFNTRRPVFADSRVREALALLFDFEWVNRSIFFGLYRRGASFFEGSELSARGRPADDARARAARPLSRRGAAGRARRHLAAAGDGRLGARPHAAAPRARIAHRGRLRAARHRAGRAGERKRRSVSRSSPSTGTRSVWRCFTQRN